jgi:hypothetical protein
MAVRKPTEWTVEEARRHLRAMVGEAKQAGPLPVEGAEDQEALVVPLSDWEKSTPGGGNLADLFLNSPLRGSDIELERDQMSVEDFVKWMKDRGTFDDLERLADALLKERGGES